MRGLPNNVKISLEKARDAALLAVEIYNKPAIKFKSGGYISMMIIAWTALFHAIYFRKKIKPFYKGENGRFKKRENDFYYWELDECLRKYFGADSSNPIRVNLQFFIPLRNKIEHRSLPEIDSNIFGECQALLLNFDEMLEKEFGSKFCLRESLSFSLQLFPSRENLSKAMTQNPTARPIINFIENYRSSVSTEVFESNKYSFKAFLIQVSNHQSKDALPIQFVHYDRLTETQKAELGKFVAMVKYKEVGISNVDKIKSGDVVKLVQSALGDPKIERVKHTVDKSNLDTHTRCWKKYGVRPDSKSKQPQETKTEYCIYDKPHKDYLYTNKWVDFLIDKMKEEEEYKSLFKK
jgi:hypothetical protein